MRQHAETAFHPCDTMAMGLDDMAVVDAQGRVHGLEGLRVVAEKMADLIRDRSPPPRIEVPYYVAKGVAARR